MTEIAKPSSIRIYYENFAQSPSNLHIHGSLRIKVGERLLPSMEYSRPDDVCFSEWLPELQQAIHELDQKPEASYTYDDHEQSQPAFRFERQHEKLFISIKENPDWQRVECLYEDFKREYEQMKADFLRDIAARYPRTYRRWLRVLAPSLMTRS